MTTVDSEISFKSVLQCTSGTGKIMHCTLRYEDVLKSCAIHLYHLNILYYNVTAKLVVQGNV